MLGSYPFENHARRRKTRNTGRSQRYAQSRRNQPQHRRPLWCILNEIRTKPFRLTARHRPVISKVTHFSGKENKWLVLQLERRNRGLRSQFVTCREHRDEVLSENRFNRQPLSRLAIAQKSKIE